MGFKYINSLEIELKKFVFNELEYWSKISNYIIDILC